ncbi:MAG: nucleotidyl transferase AbiEii/AbiGii toxin family protein [Candidatus Paceibacterota bacterium]|jgi:predicted nucleotidyltransferase component of viral defense system|nr:nucleotidyl transferase AbiEii/AbiGii toxin family protein [Candidatus Paceibacterota bacterium]
MHYEILDEQRRNILPLLAPLKNDFYLAGGTALALQLGHRDSVDFDFFSEKPLDTQKLFETLRGMFAGHELVKIQEEMDTLSVVVDERIKLSFFSYSYPMLSDLINEEYFRLADIKDIACMKLSAVTGRASNKDYIDLYYILQTLPLSHLLILAGQKFDSLDTNLILKSLIYFEDVNYEPILFKEGKEVSFEVVKTFLENEVKKISG